MSPEYVNPLGPLFFSARDAATKSARAFSKLKFENCSDLDVFFEVGEAVRADEQLTDAHNACQREVGFSLFPEPGIIGLWAGKTDDMFGPFAKGSALLNVEFFSSSVAVAAEISADDVWGDRCLPARTRSPAPSKGSEVEAPDRLDKWVRAFTRGLVDLVNVWPAQWQFQRDRNRLLAELLQEFNDSLKNLRARRSPADPAATKPDPTADDWVAVTAGAVEAERKQFLASAAETGNMNGSVAPVGLSEEEREIVAALCETNSFDKSMGRKFGDVVARAIGRANPVSKKRLFGRLKKRGIIDSGKGPGAVWWANKDHPLVKETIGARTD